jgi:glucokinase
MNGIFYIGMDLGGSNARAAAVDPNGMVLGVSKVKLTSRTPDAAVDALASCVDQVFAMLDRPRQTCIGYGLGLAGQIDARTDRVIVAPNLGWRDVDFAGQLGQRLGHAVALGNDLAVAGLGEAKAGAARGHKDAVLFYVGSGIGSALILDGRLYRGSRGISGEIGHTKVHPGGRKCGCGEHGCLEAYAGGNNLGFRVLEAVAAGRTTSVTKLVPDGARPTVNFIEQAANEGDALAQELLDEAANLIGITAANLITLLNPAVLILGGGVLLGAATVRKKVEETLRANASRPALEECLIVGPALGDDAGVIGAAFLSQV